MEFIDYLNKYSGFEISENALKYYILDLHEKFMGRSEIKVFDFSITKITNGFYFYYRIERKANGS